MGDEAIIVIGAGGHARVLIDALRERGFRITGLTDASPDLLGRTVLNTQVIGDDSILEEYPAATTRLINGIGSVASMAARQAVYERFRSKGYNFMSVFHPSAVVSRHATIGMGVQIMAGVVVQAGARIGDDTILNTRASVDHDCDIGAHCHLAPGAVLSGMVTVGESTHIGVGACVTQGVRIGAGCLVAAGAAVTKDIGNDQRVGGVPARVLGGK